MRHVLDRFGIALLMLALPAAAAAQYVPVSVGYDGSPANQGSYFPSISADGRYVAFLSYASNLVPGDTNGIGDVFVRDLQTATTTRVSVATGGAQMTGEFNDAGSLPAISGNGRFVVFTTSASLAADDAHACSFDCQDVYVHDRQTGETTLVSKSSGGVAGNRRSDNPVVSADGRFVAFTSEASNLVAGDTNARTDVFLRDRLANTTVRVSVGDGGAQLEGSSSLPQISGDGSLVSYFTLYPNRSPTYGDCSRPEFAPSCTATSIFDRTGGQSRVIDRGQFSWVFQISTDGRYLVIGRPTSVNGAGWNEFTLYDRTLAQSSSIGPSDFNRPVSLRGDGRAAVLETRSGTGSKLLLYDAASQSSVDLLTGPPLYASEPKLAADGSRVVFETMDIDDGRPPSERKFGIFALAADSDGDGMTDAWETTFGLNPHDASDAASDPDSDGATNLQEYRAGTHPNGRVFRYLAEGSSNLSFSTQIAILNPQATPAAVLITLPRAPGQDALSVVRRIPAHTRITVNPQLETERLFYGDFSTVVESDQPVVVDRTMRLLNSTGHGAHAEASIGQLSTTWYFAEGATGDPFSLFYLFENPGDLAADVTVTYLRPEPESPIVRSYAVAPHSRRTIFVDTEDPGLAATNVSARIVSSRPIVAERSLYLASLGQPLGAAAAGAGVTAPALRWLLAEGATGSFFDLYVLIVNAETSDADVTLTFLLPDGTNFTRSVRVASESRQTLFIDALDPRLADTAVSIVVESTNTVPVIVERAMWWPQGQWYEGHLSAGAVGTSHRWALAEGEVGGYPEVAETYILIANTSSIAGSATVTLMFEDGSTTERVLALPANSRTNLSVGAEIPVARGRRFGAIIDSATLDLVVERSMYSNVDGVMWAAGTAALGTPLP